MDATERDKVLPPSAFRGRKVLPPPPPSSPAFQSHHPFPSHLSFSLSSALLRKEDEVKFPQHPFDVRSLARFVSFVRSRACVCHKEGLLLDAYAYYYHTVYCSTMLVVYVCTSSQSFWSFGGTLPLFLCLCPPTRTFIAPSSSSSSSLVHPSIPTSSLGLNAKQADPLCQSLSVSPFCPCAIKVGCCVQPHLKAGRLPAYMFRMLEVQKYPTNQQANEQRMEAWAGQLLYE